MPTVRGYHFIPLRTIAFLQKQNQNTLIYLENKKVVEALKPIDYYCSFLSKSGFYKVHEDYLINIQHIKSYDPNQELFTTYQGLLVPSSEEEIRQLMKDLGMGKGLEGS